jgi:hypothetical protein
VITDVDCYCCSTLLLLPRQSRFNLTSTAQRQHNKQNTLNCCNFCRGNCDLCYCCSLVLEGGSALMVPGPLFQVKVSLAFTFALKSDSLLV